MLQSISVNGQPGFRLVPLDPVNGPIVNSTVYTTSGGGDLGGTAATSFLNVQQLDSTNGTVIDPGLVTAVKTGATFGADPIYSLRDAENTIAPAFIGAGLVKIVENVSPIPRDRIYFNFSAFDNVPISNSGITVNRFTPGIEKTFLDGNFSIETRVPFATTLDSNVTLDGLTNTRQVELGNVAVTGKVLFYTDDHWAFSGGVQTLLPTADDLTMNLSTGEELLRVKNQSVHVQPFFGSVWTPSERFFMQSILQVDVAANSNSVLGRDFVAESAAPAFNGTRFKEIGKIDDVPFLYATAVGGYWLAHPDEDEGFISGFATTLELHYNRSLKTTDRITDGTYTIGDRAKNIEVLNMTVGGHMKFSNSSFLSVGYTVPLAGGADEQFDGEVRVMLNYLFGDAAKKRANPTFR